VQNLSKLLVKAFNMLAGLLKLKTRIPCSEAVMVALPGAILILTKDGNNILVTLSAAKDIAKKIPEAVIAASAPLN